MNCTREEFGSDGYRVADGGVGQVFWLWTVYGREFKSEFACICIQQDIYAYD